MTSILTSNIKKLLLKHFSLKLNEQDNFVWPIFVGYRARICTIYILRFKLSTNLPKQMLDVQANLNNCIHFLFVRN